MTDDILNVDLSEATKTYPLTDQQQAIVSYELKDGHLLKVIAYAGAGKTSTFVAVAEANPEIDITYLAFNKSVEQEAKNRFPGNTLVKTSHAMAYSKVGCKYREIAGSTPIWQLAKAFRVNYYEATLLQRSLENYLGSADEHVTVNHIEEDHLERMDKGYEENMVEACEAVWQRIINQRDGFRMTHSGYLKLYQLSKPILPGHLILLDEAQDTNLVVQDIITSQLAYGKRVMLCGDPYQQIYAWRGAIDALKRIEGPELYLTQSWRFGPDIAKYANLLLNTFFNEQVPLVGNGSMLEHDGRVTTVSRTNAQLFHLIVPIVEQGESYHVVGREAFMVTLDLLEDAYWLMINRKEKIRDQRIARYKDWKDYTEYAEATLDNEAVVRINLVKEYLDSIPDLCRKMRLFYSSSQDVPARFVTCHKAKGLEWPLVQLANDFTPLFNEKGQLKTLAPPCSERNDSTIASDEVNLLYVASTRAKVSLQLNQDMKRLVRLKETQ